MNVRRVVGYVLVTVGGLWTVVGAGGILQMLAGEILHFGGGGGEGPGYAVLIALISSPGLGLLFVGRRWVRASREPELKSPPDDVVRAAFSFRSVAGGLIGGVVFAAAGLVLGTCFVLPFVNTVPKPYANCAASVFGILGLILGLAWTRR